MKNPLPLPVFEQDKKSIAYAKKGILLAIISGIVFSGNGLIVTHGKSFYPFTNPELSILIPFLCAGLNDFFAGCIVTAINIKKGRMRELGRSIVSRPGRYVIFGAIIGATCGMTGYMIALHLIGPAYVLPITSLYPAVASVLAVIFLKENIKRLAWVGLICCIFGAIIIGYSPPAGENYEYFYIGLFFAALTAVGWGSEGVCATSGMDFIDPPIALNMYYMVSSILFWGIFIPIVGMIVLPKAGGISALLEFFSSEGLKFFALAGAFGSISYSCWYKAMHMTGVSRAMALNISYALWGIVFSALFTEIQITTTLVLGAVVIFVGMLLVIGNPKDMLNLRKID